MKRTQVYIDMDTYRQAITQARMTKTTLSELVRRGLKTQVKPKKSHQEFAAWVKQFLKKYPTPKNTPTDIALEHDHYLYGTPKKYSKP